MTPAQYAAAVLWIKNSIAATCQSAVPTAKVINHFVRERQGNAWAASLESEQDLDGNGAPKIRAITVDYIGFLNRGKLMLQSLSSRPIFHVAFWVQLENVDDTNNANNTILLDSVTCVASLFKATDLGDRSLVEGHEQLILPPRPDIIPMGDRQALYMPGTISVLMQSKQIT